MAIFCSKGHRMKCLATRQNIDSVARRYWCPTCDERKSTHEYLEGILPLSIRRRLASIVDEAVKLMKDLK